MSIGTPVLTFVGVLIAQRVMRVGAKELETRSNREETMRNLRWAAEMSVSDDLAQARLGLAQLRALDESKMLDAEQQVFIDAALDAVLIHPVEEIDEAGGDAEVVRVEPDATAGPTGGGVVPLRSDADGSDDGGGD
ncbi:hypothetical protein [uncultured Jatrophihabitans sp.]|uniref:hypothetical protein n=1 Tax=uncultured Jatrophihabitans sp. TaxID=1610747 RepID=UPI0035CBC351